MVNFGTDWKAQAEQGGFYQAIATGIYKKHGLEVNLRQGGPQVNHAQLLAAGVLDFNIGSNSFVPLNFVQQNIPMLAVAAIFQKDPTVLIAHPGQGDDTPGGAERQADHDRLRHAGHRLALPEAEIRLYRRPDPALHVQLAPFLADPKAIQQGYVTSEPFTSKRRASSRSCCCLADAGYSSYGSLIQTSRKLAQEKPDLVQRFVNASIEGWYSYLYDDPGAGQRADQERQPRDDRRAVGERPGQDEGIRHHRQRRRQRNTASAR